MKSRTPKKKAPVEKNIDGSSGFVDQAEEPKRKRKKKIAMPWEASEIRDDVTKIFNLRLSEKHFIMLKFLAENQRKESMQSICLDALEPMLERESLALFEKLEKNKKR